MATPTWKELSAITDPAKRWAAAAPLLSTGQAKWGLGADPNNPGEYGYSNPFAGVDIFDQRNSPTIEGYRGLSVGGQDRGEWDTRDGMMQAFDRIKGAIYDPQLTPENRTYYVPNDIADQLINSGTIPTPTKDPNDTGHWMEKVVLGTIGTIAGAGASQFLTGFDPIASAVSRLTGQGAGAAGNAAGSLAGDAASTVANSAGTVANSAGTAGRSIADILNAGAGDIASTQFSASPFGTVAPGSLADIANVASGGFPVNGAASFAGGLPTADLVRAAGTVAGSPGASVPGAATGAGSAAGGLLSAINSPLGMGLLGAGLGAIDGTKQTGSTTVETAPWSGQQPYLLDLFKRAQAATNKATGSNPLEDQATGQMQTAATGSLTNPFLGMDNPYLKNQINMASQDIMENLQPQWGGAQIKSGSFGNSGVNEAFGKAAADQVGKVAQNMRFNDYTQQQGLAESDVNRRFGAVNNLYQVGRQQRTNAFEPLKQYGDLIRGSYGQTQTTPQFSNPFAGALGGGLLGTQIYKMFNQ